MSSKKVPISTTAHVIKKLFNDKFDELKRREALIEKAHGLIEETAEETYEFMDLVLRQRRVGFPWAILVGFLLGQVFTRFLFGDLDFSIFFTEVGTLLLTWLYYKISIEL